MSIEFGGITFTDPVKFEEWAPKLGPGLYCICVHDQDWRPAPFRPIFIAQAPNLAEDGLLQFHPALSEWSSIAGGAEHLLVCDAYLPQFSPDFLTLFERRLIMGYRPACNSIDALPEIKLPRKPRHQSTERQLDPALAANHTDADSEKPYAEL
jgi:hypothetical protein